MDGLSQTANLQYCGNFKRRFFGEGRERGELFLGVCGAPREVSVGMKKE